VPLTCSNSSGVIDFLGQQHPWRLTECTGDDTIVSASSVTDSPLPPFALEAPYGDPFAGTCLLRHLRTTGWNIRVMSMQLNNSLGPLTMAEIGFFANDDQLRAGNSNAVPVHLVQGTNDTDGSQWNDCYLPSETNSNNQPCRFRFDSATGRFTLTRFTQCNDIDRQHPWVFKLPFLSDVTLTPRQISHYRHSELCRSSYGLLVEGLLPGIRTQSHKVLLDVRKREWLDEHRVTDRHFVAADASWMGSQSLGRSGAQRFPMARAR
jgi:hypothetical protein